MNVIGVSDKRVGVPVFGANSARIAKEREPIYKSIFSLPVEIFPYESFDDFLRRASRAVPDHARVGGILIDAKLCAIDGLGSFEDITKSVMDANIPIPLFFMSIDDADCSSCSPVGVALQTPDIKWLSGEYLDFCSRPTRAVYLAPGITDSNASIQAPVFRRTTPFVECADLQQLQFVLSRVGGKAFAVCKAKSIDEILFVSKSAKNILCASC